MQNEIAKLKALQIRIGQLYNEYDRFVPKNEVIPLINQLKSIVDKLLKVNKELFGDFQLQNYSSCIVDVIYYQRIVFTTITNDIDYFLNLYKEANVSQVDRVTISEKGIFLNGEYFDALFKVVSFIAEAEKEIILIDGYIDEKVISLFQTKNRNVLVKLLTKSQSIVKVSALVEAFNKQYCNLEIKSSEVFHDRFLIVDNKSFYHFGASIKDVGKKGFMFSKIDEKLLQDILIQEFNRCWSGF